MTEHDHDLDLIAAYAAGDDLPEAASLVGSCPECRAEYGLQRRVAEWLAAAPSVTLLPEERSTLRAAVRPRRRPRLAWAYGAAGAAGGVAAVVLALNLGSPQQTADNTALEAAPTAPLGRYEEGREAATTAAAAPTTTAAASLAGQPETTLAPVDTIEELEAEVQAMLAGIGDYGASALSEQFMTDGDDCLIEVERVVLVARGELGKRAVVVYVVDEEPGPRARAFYVDDCQELGLEEG